MSIDDCKDCKFFIGPTKGSIFLRDSENCVIVSASGQFRTRDCVKIDAFIHCDSQPIIESTTNFRVSCFQYYYDELEDQFEKADLSPFNNLWYNIHDFTPPTEGKNFKILGEYFKVSDYLPQPESEELKSLYVTMEQSRSVVPITCLPWRSGNVLTNEYNNIAPESTFAMVVGGDRFQNEKCQLFIQKMVGSDQDGIDRIELLNCRRFKVDGAAFGHFSAVLGKAMVSTGFANAFFVSSFFSWCA